MRRGTFVVLLAAGFLLAMSELVPSGMNVVAAEAAQPVAINASQLGQPEVMQQLCDLVRQRNGEIDARKQGLVHTEISTNIELDKQGQTTLREKKTERVRYQDGQEFRRVEKLVDDATGADKTPPGAKDVPQPKFEALFPMSTNEPAGAYRYKYLGNEIVNDRNTWRIGFEPTPPLENRFRGDVWIDPQTYEPVRFLGAWAQPPRFVQQMSMQLDWARSENGHTQVRRSVVVGQGGFAFIQKRYRIETEITDYRPPR